MIMTVTLAMSPLFIFITPKILVLIVAMLLALAVSAKRRLLDINVRGAGLKRPGGQQKGEGKV